VNALSLSVSSSVISFSCLGPVATLGIIQSEVAGMLSGHWVDHVNRNDYSGEWDVLPLRCKAEHLDAHPILQGFSLESDGGWQNLPPLKNCPALGALIESLQCPVKAVRLMRLKGGAHIKPHRDIALGIDFGEARLHLPVFTSDQVGFWVDGKSVPMAAGELWYINADQVHEVRNYGSSDRINLVIDCTANEWLCRKIIQGAA
jgi:hypothetical protein